MIKMPFCPKLAWLGKTDSSERSESEAQPLHPMVQNATKAHLEGCLFHILKAEVTFGF
jgi:hypothetical protein